MTDGIVSSDATPTYASDVSIDASPSVDASVSGTDAAFLRDAIADASDASFDSGDACAGGARSRSPSPNYSEDSQREMQPALVRFHRREDPQGSRHPACSKKPSPGRAATGRPLACSFAAGNFMSLTGIRTMESSIENSSRRFNPCLSIRLLFRPRSSLAWSRTKPPAAALPVRSPVF